MPPTDLQHLHVQSWGTAHGLPEEAIYSIAESADGYIWLATPDGLVRFNGLRFENFSLAGNIGIRDSAVNAVFSNGNKLWVSGRDFVGVTEMDHFRSFTRLDFQNVRFPRHPAAREGTLSLNAGSNGSIFLRRADGIFSISRKGSADNLPPPKLFLAPPAGESILGFHEGRSGKLWIVTGTGLKVRSGDSWERVASVPNRRATLLEAGDGSVWASTTEGVYQWGKSTSAYFDLSDKKSIGPLRGLLEDREGSIWVGLVGGVARIRSGRMEHLDISGHMRPDDLVQTFYQSADGMIWGGTRWGGLLRIGARVFATVAYQEGLGDGAITSVQQDAQGRIWVGTRTEGAFVQEMQRWRRVPDTRPFLLSMAALRDGRMLGMDSSGLWIGDRNRVRQIIPVERSLAGQFTSFSPDYGDHIFFNDPSRIYRLRLPVGHKPEYERIADIPSVRALIEKPDGIWAVSWDRGLQHIEGGKVTSYPLDDGSERRSLSLHELTPDLLLVGTSTGLYGFDKRQRRFLSKEPAFSKHQIFFMQPDREGHLWLAARKALLAVTQSALAEYFRGAQDVILPLQLTTQHGLSSTNFGLGTSSTGILARSGEIWLSSLGGAIRFHPGDVFSTGEDIPCAVDELAADGVPIPVARTVNLPPGTQRLEIRYTVLGRNAGKSPAFRFRLMEDSQSWMETDEDRAVYTNLKPGTYTFEVQARVSSHEWSKSVASFDVAIASFWYQQRSVQALGAISLILLSGMAARLRNLRIRRHTEELEARVRARTAELALARDEAERSRLRAEEANRVKSEFLANMSHEIRTPLNGVIGMTEVALQTPLTAAQRELLSLAKLSADVLLSVLNDVLDFSKIEAGKSRLDPAPFSLAQLAEDTVKIVSLSAHKKALTLTCRLPEDLPQLLIGDSGRLRQILLNLLANAVKFTEKGKVSLTVAIEARTASAITLHFAVQDTGIGIPAESLTRIFEAFEQADSSTTRRYGGSGLGLAITSGLVRMMSGRIWVDSEPGNGSTFHFSIPLGVVEESLSEQELRRNEQLNPGHALVLTSSKSDCLLMQENLAKWAISVTCVDTPQQVLTELAGRNGERNAYSLVIFDEDMGLENGTSLAAEVQECARRSKAGIVILTSPFRLNESLDTEQGALAIRLLKPVSADALYQAVLEATGNLPLPMEAEKHRTEAWRHSIHILLAEDNVVNQQVAMRMLESCGYKVTVVENGLKALIAWEQQQFNLLLFDVHMPEMDGLAAAAEIRRRESGASRIPIIALTAGATQEDRDKCLDAGMDEYLVKPVHFKSLLQAVERRIGPKAQQGYSDN